MLSVAAVHAVEAVARDLPRGSPGAALLYLHRHHCAEVCCELSREDPHRRPTVTVPSAASPGQSNRKTDDFRFLKARVPAPLPRIGRAVICYRKSAV